MNYQEHYNSYIVDPDLDCRMRLRQATRAVAAFKEVTQFSHLHEALGKLKDSSAINVIFLSSRFAESEIITFIQQAKEIPAGQDTAYVLILAGSEKGSASIVTKMIGGADGLLFEPFSVESLAEMTALASKVKKERSRSREMAAITLLIKQVMSQIDSVAELRAGGYEAGVSMKNLREMLQVVRTLDPEMLQHYFEQTVELFQKATPSRRKIYSGASKRIKKKTEERLQASGAIPAPVPGELKKEAL